MSLKQKKIKFKPRTKLNHNKYINNISYICTCTTEWRSKGWWSGESLCGLGSNSSIDTIFGLSLLLVLSFAARGFSPGTPVFPSPQKPEFPNSNLTRIQVDEEPLCGCTTSTKSLFILFYSFKNLNAKKIIAV